AETAVMKQFLYERKRSAENRAAQGAVLAKHGSRKAGKPAAPRRRSGGAKARTAVAEQPRTPDLFAGPEP
ncbi:MAG TPA: hypothetical protein VFW49_04115, partial [Fluviicoccus sp.]|nr:hypothetical protein [Fluviicoccus sp.]